MKVKSDQFRRFSETVVWIIWLLALLGTLSIMIIKIVSRDTFQSIRLEYVLLGLIALLVFPYLSNINAFGVKIEIQKKVEYLDKQVKALPDYIIGSEYEREGDFSLAEESYNNCLKQDANYWPAILALGSIAENEKRYESAIRHYKNVVKIDPDNIYALNNLANIYVDSPPPVQDLEQGIQWADKALSKFSGMWSALLIKCEALDRLHKYNQALPLLQGLLDENKIPSQKHWVMHELAIANSNNGRSLKANELNRIYSVATDNNEGEYFLETLSEERGRFSKKDLKTVNAFLLKKGPNIRNK